MRETTVRKHKRKIPRGGTTSVVRHSRSLPTVKRVPHTTRTDQDQLEEWIGEQSLADKKWIPLDPNYPNVLGVPPERIDWLISQFPDERSEKAQARWEASKEHGEYNAPIVNEADAIVDLKNSGFTKKDVIAVIKRTHFYDRDDVFEKSKVIHKDYLKKTETENERDIEFINEKFDLIEQKLDAEGSPLHRKVSGFFMDIYHQKDGKSFEKEMQLKQMLNAPMKGFIPSGSSKEDLEYMVKKYPNPDMHSIRGYIGNLAEENPKDERVWELHEKYVESGKKKISKTDLFTVLTYKIDEISTEARREKSFRGDVKHSSKEFMELFSLKDFHAPYELDQLIETHIKSKKLTFTKDDMAVVKSSLKESREMAIEQVKTRDSVYANETIYVTSPRGGHEFLSIYAYANSIDKSNIPSDIKSGHPKRLQTGLTYIGNKTGEIKRVVVVDDVVGSGQQKQEFYKSLRTQFPDARLYYNTLSMRKEEYQQYPLNLQSVKENEKKLFSDRGFSAMSYADETVGLKGYKNGIKGNVGAVFPWAIPDGSSDKIARILVESKDEKMRNVGTRRYKRDQD